MVSQHHVRLFLSGRADCSQRRRRHKDRWSPRPVRREPFAFPGVFETTPLHRYNAIQPGIARRRLSGLRARAGYGTLNSCKLHDLLAKRHAIGNLPNWEEVEFVSTPAQAVVRRASRRPAMNVFSSLTALLLLAGCGSADFDRTTGGPPAAATSGAVSPDARELGEDNDELISARAVVAALALRGYLVPNMLDVTDQICPTVGCAQVLVTDTLRVTSFASPDAATDYAQERGLRHRQNIVVAFPPVMTASDQDKYWSAIVRIFP